ncbi:MAG: hypothetical protein P8H25_05910 [Flavobacteriaceae bacterium]|nr:hypothetical protein [Flavobacteriaceae bacterium]
MKKASLLLILLGTQFTFGQAIRTQRVFMDYEQLPLSPILTPEKTYFVGLDSNYLSYAREVRKLNIEFLEDEDNTVGRFLGRAAMRTIMHKDSVSKLIALKYEDKMRSLRDLKRAYYPYDKWVAKSNVIVNGATKAQEIENADLLILIKPSEAKFRIYERSKDGRFSFDIKGRLSVDYTLINKEGDTLHRDRFTAKNYGIAATKWYPRKEILHYVWEEMPNNPEILKSIDEWHRDAFVKLTENLTAALSDRYGHYIKRRSLHLYRIKPKKYDYIDFEKALNDLSEGLKLHLSNREESKKRLHESIVGFKKIVSQHEPGKRKQRIDDKVAGAAQYNIAEAHLWLGDFEQCNTLITIILEKNLGNNISNAAKRLMQLSKTQQERLRVKETTALNF